VILLDTETLELERSAVENETIVALNAIERRPMVVCVLSRQTPPTINSVSKP
jgi:hypothetical protein